MFASKVSAKGLEFTLHISPNTPTTVLLDGNRLRQILTNLVGNAVKFTDHGSVTVRIKHEEKGQLSANNRQSSTCQPVSGQASILRFLIADTGIGIPEDEQARMFEPFQQQAPGGSGGSGLGLAITQRLVDLMQGAISVESTVNEGTIFSVVLPAAKIAVEEKEPDEHEVDLSTIRFQGATILFAEDKATNREVVRAYVASHDLHLIEAENGQEACQLTKQIRPDLILMDILMPVMNGYEATQCIKAEPDLRTIPVVALTAYAVKEQQEEYQNIYDAYLTKPISKHELIAALAKFLPHTKIPLNEEELTPGPSRLSACNAQAEEGNVRRILEELNAYAAHTGTFPQALLDTVHVELLPSHKEICLLMSIDETLAFAETIMAVADAFTIPPLKYYGKELLRSTNVFDVTSMKRLLAVFPEIAEIIGTYTKPIVRKAAK